MEQPYLAINAGHIHAFDEDLYRQLVCYPQEVIPTMDMAVNEMFFEKYPDTVLSHQVIKSFHSNYRGDPNNRLALYGNGQKLFGW